MQNEKGITLVELMATIAISFIVLSVVSSLFFFIFHYVQDSTKYTKGETNRIVLQSYLNNHLSSPKKVLYWSSNEIRFKTSDDQYLSLSYNNSEEILTIYKCISCENVKAFSNDSVELTIDEVQDIKLLDKDDSIPNIDEEEYLTSPYTLYISYKNLDKRPSGKELMTNESLTWTFTPLPIDL